MRTISLLMIAALSSVSLAGCIVRTHDHHSHSRSHVRARECPPAYHWEGGACVHNGNGKAKGHRR